MKHTTIFTDALTGLLPDEIAERLGLPAMRGKQIFQWIHQKKIFELDEMTNLPESLRASIDEQAAVSSLSEVTHQYSEQSGTVKALFSLKGGDAIESVLLRHGDRVTCCLSTQVGCALGCSFCATGQAGFRRNLSPAEIVEQALFLCQEAGLSQNVTPNIVFMGMGEPFQNYDALIKSIDILMHPLGLHIGARKIAVSTVGDVKGILKFAEELWQVRLSVSLHAATDALRDQLIPINKRYPLKKLHKALCEYQRKRGRQITIEYILLNEVNDAPEQAVELAGFLQGLDAMVNIIPWNEVAGLPFSPSPSHRVAAFVTALNTKGVKATVRKERGSDIDAACGQLRALRQLSSDGEE
ncbi:MAG: 23S rRNA (adenine(2503)-C(2))-methyltransferase RlmN, partial [Candidatus Hydrogenedentes bacterium]|nr:23S rRNA (adenine(2503)-C(2))-methyltransferase RlmN [Candidatus Hydrogenedentota bacterium]